MGCEMKEQWMVTMLKALNVNKLDEQTYIKRFKIGPTKKFSKRVLKKYGAIEEDSMFVVTPQEVEEDVVIYLHGGAFMGGVTRSHLTFISKVANALHTPVYMIDYPLIPSFTNEAIVSFCLQKYEQIALKHATQRIIIMGDSAGGGLVFTLNEHIKGRKPSCLVALCPWLDLSVVSIKDDLVLNRSFLKTCGQVYANGDVKNPSISPLFASYKSLPEVLLVTCTGDLLYEEAVQFYQKNINDNHVIKLYERQGLFHTYFLFSLQATKETIDWLKHAIKEA